MTDCSFLKLLVQMLGVPMRFYTILIICLAKNGMKYCYRYFRVLFPEFVAGKNALTKRHAAVGSEKSINSSAALQLKTIQHRAMKLYRWNGKILKNRFIFI